MITDAVNYALKPSVFFKDVLLLTAELRDKAANLIDFIQVRMNLDKDLMGVSL